MRYVLVQTLLLGSLMVVAITGVGPYWGPAWLMGGDAGTILCLVGGSICGASVLLALSTIVFYLQKSRHEERLLRERYPEYRNYVEQTRGVVPFQRWW